MNCRFCNREQPKFAKAHIIPRSFYKAVRGTGKYSVLIQASKTEIKQDAKQAGIYDHNILCEECEGRFNKFDDHGFRVFTGVFRKRELYRDHDGIPCAYLLPNARYDLLKLFVLSLYWRASVSNLPFFSNVSLEHHEAHIRDMIEAQDPGEVDEYSFFCIHLPNAKYRNIILPPTPRKLDGMNCVQLHLPNLYIMLKVDTRPFSEPFSSFIIRREPPHYLAFQAYAGEREDQFIRAFKSIIRQHDGS